MKLSFNRLFRIVFRNNYSREGNKISNHVVNLEWYKDDLNLGDYLSKVVVNHMTSIKGIKLSDCSFDRKRKHLMAIGSLLGGRGDFNATVWGSGIRNFSSVKGLALKRFYQKLDIRAVRGPFTKSALEQCGFRCPEVYGDPAVLMPCVYTPECKDRKGVVLIKHYLSSYDDLNDKDIVMLDIKTDDYKSFIDTVVSAEKVISSSLHGIILAETYGVPAVFLRSGIEAETIKFYDWYYSTERYNVRVAHSIDEALNAEPMPLPNLSQMRENLINVFPYDLWLGKKN